MRFAQTGGLHLASGGVVARTTMARRGSVLVGLDPSALASQVSGGRGWRQDEMKMLPPMTKVRALVVGHL